MKIDKLTELFKKYNLSADDVFQHKHYKIITRQGIDKIQAIEKIFIKYNVVAITPEFCGVKAIANKDNANIETFGSAKYGGKTWDDVKKKWNEVGNTNSWYVLEIAEKRAMSRAVLKLCGFYELGVFGEDESEDFKRETPKKQPKTTVKTPSEKLKECKTLEELKTVFTSLTRTEQTAMKDLTNELKTKLS